MTDAVAAARAALERARDAGVAAIKQRSSYRPSADQVRKWRDWWKHNEDVCRLLDELIDLRRLAAVVRRNEHLRAESMDPEIGDGYYSDLIALMENNAIEIVTLAESAGEEVVE